MHEIDALMLVQKPFPKIVRMAKLDIHARITFFHSIEVTQPPQSHFLYEACYQQIFCMHLNRFVYKKNRLSHFDIGNPVAYSAKHSERLSHRPQQQQLQQCTVAQ